MLEANKPSDAHGGGDEVAISKRADGKILYMYLPWGEKMFCGFARGTEPNKRPATDHDKLGFQPKLTLVERTHRNSIDVQMLPEP
jgi:hypothetical protein